MVKEKITLSWMNEFRKLLNLLPDIGATKVLNLFLKYGKKEEERINKEFDK